MSEEYSKQPSEMKGLTHSIKALSSHLSDHGFSNLEQNDDVSTAQIKSPGQNFQINPASGNELIGQLGKVINPASENEANRPLGREIKPLSENEAIEQLGKEIRISEWDPEEKADLATWDPMKEHYEQSVDEDYSAEKAVCGYAAKDESWLCLLFARTGKCFKMDRGHCKKEHLSYPEGAIYTRDQRRVWNFFMMETPDIGSEIKVIVTNVINPLDFYVRILEDVVPRKGPKLYDPDTGDEIFDDDENFDKFQEYLNSRKIAEKLTPLNTLPALGQATVVQVGSRLYRAALQHNVTDNSGMFYFYDYGIIKEVPYSNAKQMIEELAWFPSRVYKCALANVETSDKNNLGEDFTSLKNCLNEICYAYVANKTYDERKLHITLGNSKCVDVGEQLSQTGFWKLNKVETLNFADGSSTPPFIVG